MAHELTTEELKRLARLGAAARLAQLEAERLAILRAFPGLTSAARPKTAAPATGEPRETAVRKKARKRRPMTAEQKRAASERMKKYWAARKQG
jgi:hypothetical protein